MDSNQSFTDKFNSALLILIVLIGVGIFTQKLTADQYLVLIGSVAWPLSSLSIALIFEREISAFLGRMTNAKLPGGIEFEASQKQVEESSLLEESPTTSEESSPGSPEEISEFKELESFLVLNSKGALKWFQSRGEPVSLLAFLINFALPFPQVKPDFDYAKEKLNILKALADTYLIESPTTNKFKISAKGNRFLRHLGI